MTVFCSREEGRGSRWWSSLHCLCGPQQHTTQGGWEIAFHWTPPPPLPPPEAKSTDWMDSNHFTRFSTPALWPLLRVRGLSVIHLSLCLIYPAQGTPFSHRPQFCFRAPWRYQSFLRGHSRTGNGMICWHFHLRLFFSWSSNRGKVRSVPAKPNQNNRCWRLEWIERTWCWTSS